MPDRRRIQRELINELTGGSQRKPIRTGKVYDVDRTTMTAKVRVGGSDSAQIMGITNRELTERLANAVESGNIPSISHTNGLISDLTISASPVQRSVNLSAIESPGHSGGAPSPHEIGGSHHVGTIRNDQGPQFLLVDGSRPLVGDLLVQSGTTIDGVDIDLHALNKNAHHQAFVGFYDDLGSEINPDESDRIQIVSNDPDLITVSGESQLQFQLNSSDDPGLSRKILRTDSAGKLRISGLDMNGDLHFNTGAVSSTGHLLLNPGSGYILPSDPYSVTIGSLQKKMLGLHAAELYVDTLVAQEKIGTIGGHVLVGITTILVSDIAPESTSIVVKHNSLVLGDTVYLEGNGKVEFMRITSHAEGSGPFTYNVQRYLNGGDQ